MWDSRGQLKGFLELLMHSIQLNYKANISIGVENDVPIEQQNPRFLPLIYWKKLKKQTVIAQEMRN